MRIRENSPFYGITEGQKEKFLDEAEQLSHLRIAELWEERSGRETTEGQVKRFLQRLRYERSIRETDDSKEDWETFAERAQDGKARDGLIEAARQKLFEEALANGDRALLLELYRAANEERAREREVIVEQRKAAVAEENAMIGWSKVPGGRPTIKRWLKADVTEGPALAEGVEQQLVEASQMLEMLTDGTKTAEERIASILECLSAGRKLLPHGDGTAHAVEATGQKDEKLKAPKIDWDAPYRSLVASLPFAHLYAKEKEAGKVEAEEDNDKDEEGV